MPAITLERSAFQRSVLLPAERLSPFVPSSPQAIVGMLELARVGPRDRLFDLGSGDGRIVVMAAQRFGADATGIELDGTGQALISPNLRVRFRQARTDRTRQYPQRRPPQCFGGDALSAIQREQTAPPIAGTTTLSGSEGRFVGFSGARLGAAKTRDGHSR